MTEGVNGILNLYKPCGITSHGALSAVKRIFGVKKAGHCGTLDPMACGVLPVMLGSAVKASEYLTDHDKRYTASVALGFSTDTQDIHGSVTERYDGPLPSLEEVRETAKGFVGVITQIPPMYSALKRNGQKLVDLARKGISVEREGREVTVYSLDVYEKDGEIMLDVACSRGTYIRTLCHDIGEALGCHACMKSLERTAVGRFEKSEAVSLAELESLSDAGRAALVLPTERCFDFPALVLPPFYEKLFRNGCEIYARDLGEAGKTLSENAMYRIYGEDGFFAFGKCAFFPGKSKDGQAGLAVKSVKFF